jgi:hypothetical protein
MWRYIVGFFVGLIIGLGFVPAVRFIFGLLFHF